MAVHHLPFLAEDEYHEFWRLLRPHVPSCYDDWVSEYWRVAQSLRMRGHSVAKVDVQPAEFARYCRFRERDYDPQSLTDFAMEKAQGRGF